MYPQPIARSDREKRMVHAAMDVRRASCNCRTGASHIAADAAKIRRTNKKRFRGAKFGLALAAVTVLRVSVEVAVVPLGVSEAWEKRHDAAVGKFKQLSETWLLKPTEGAIETLSVTDCPETTLADDGCTDRTKPDVC